VSVQVWLCFSFVVLSEAKDKPCEGGSRPSLACRSSAEAGKAVSKFTRWDLVDLSQFRVKLKAEFQASNQDMYRPEAIVATSGK